MDQTTQKAMLYGSRVFKARGDKRCFLGSNFQQGPIKVKETKY